jgi:hypothetical protein
MARAINSSIINKLNAIGNKINALRNAVAAISNIGSLPELPNLNNLLSVAELDLNQYRQLQAACPQLNLPDVGGLPSVPDLQSLLGNSFGNAIQNLDQSAYGMLNAIQNQFNSEIAALLAELGPVTSLLNCLCQSANFSNSIKPPEVGSAIQTYNYISGQGPTGSPSILSDTQQHQVSNYQATRSSLRQLLTVPSA